MSWQDYFHKLGLSEVLIVQDSKTISLHKKRWQIFFGQLSD